MATFRRSNNRQLLLAQVIHLLPRFQVPSSLLFSLQQLWCSFLGHKVRLTSRTSPPSHVSLSLSLSLLLPLLLPRLILRLLFCVLSLNYSSSNNNNNCFYFKSFAASGNQFLFFFFFFSSSSLLLLACLSPHTTGLRTSLLFQLK